MTIELRHILTGMATSLDTPAAVGRFLAHRSPDEWEGWSHLHAAPDFKAAFEVAVDEEPQELPVDAQVASAMAALAQEQQQQHAAAAESPAPAPAPVVMRAKLRVVGVQQYKQDNGTMTQEDVEFTAVSKDGGYPGDGSDENNTFAKWTPMASAKFSIMNPALHGAFAAGDEFYADFTLAKKAAPQIPPDRIGGLTQAQRDKEASGEAMFRLAREQAATGAAPEQEQQPQPAAAAPAAPGNQEPQA